MSDIAGSKNVDIKNFNWLTNICSYRTSWYK